MAKITLEEFYYGDKYNVYGNALAEFLRKDKSTNIGLTGEEITEISILVADHSVVQTLNLIKNNDFVAELESEIKSFFYARRWTMSNLERLYHIFYRPSEQSWLNNNVDRLRSELKASISDEDRKKVLRIVDDLSLIKDLQLKESFVAGFSLGLDLKEELKHYLHEEHTEKERSHEN